jgi:hypothetical protein
MRFLVQGAAVGRPRLKDSHEIMRHLEGNLLPRTMSSPLVATDICYGLGFPTSYSLH